MLIFATDYAVLGKKRWQIRCHASRWNPLKEREQLMYAIVEINGQQFKVEAGKRLFVHRMSHVEPEQDVEFDKVLLLDNDGTVTVGAPVVEGAKVSAQVVEPLVKGDKVLVFHKKRRKGYRKMRGHRQQFTELKVKEIIA